MSASRQAIIVLLAAVMVMVSPRLIAGQEEPASLPATAVVRGENIWLQPSPGNVAVPVAYLQRGDAITITGEAVTADGAQYYPVQVTATGDTGWVAQLFIDPASVVPVSAATADTAEPADIAEPVSGAEQSDLVAPAAVAATPAPPDDDGRARRRNRDRDAAASQPEAGMQGLGLTLRQLRALLGPADPTLTGDAFATDKGVLAASAYEREPVAVLERVYDTGVSYDEARAASEALMPADAMYQTTIVTSLGVTVDVYFSQALQQTFPDRELWINAEPGTLTVGYFAYAPDAGVTEVTRWILAIGNPHPGTPT